MVNSAAILLGVNVDHVATLRQARGTHYPDPAMAARLAEQAGADSITVHLREDRRHIQERDLRIMRSALRTRMNLELAVNESVIRIAEDLRPQDCCFVPERREEITTEGGLDVTADLPRIAGACQQLAAVGCRVALFIDPELRQIDAARAAGVDVIELHTGRYADAPDDEGRGSELLRLRRAAAHAARLGIEVHAGHGLHYQNVQAVAALPEVCELNIGHAIIARAVFDGMANAVREMKQLMLDARRG